MPRRHPTPENTPQDVEGNSIRIGKGAPVEDVEGNAMKAGHAPVEDVEGNSTRWSDVEIKHDVTPVSKPTSTSDDVEGNSARPRF